MPKAPDGKWKPYEGRVVFVEYHDGKPFSVVTMNDAGGREDWDFEWCKRDTCLYYSKSGGGGEALRQVLHRFKPKPAPGAVQAWAAPDVFFYYHPRGQRLRSGRAMHARPISRREASRRFGYTFIPRLPEDPFESFDAGQSDTVYCRVCDDRLPDSQQVCEHLVYLDGLGYAGCGSEDNDYFGLKYAKDGLFAVLAHTGLARQFREALVAGTLWMWPSGGQYPGELACRFDGRWSPDESERFEEGDEDAMGPGVAWLSTLQHGVTTEDTQLTITWIDEWLASPAAQAQHQEDAADD